MPSMSAPPLEIGFNARYMLDMMQQIDGAGGRGWRWPTPPHRP